ncbi:MAG TPA: hypothetical protein VN894_06750 [Polyangiaceae bacterium]|nr:hypothetical protein [Polyangiaceae bacterium]
MWFALAGAGLSCGAAAENAAARDPMKCERNPACAQGRSSYADCTRQCVDDPQCVSLCREIQGGVDGWHR